ncbi:RNA polymerase II elongation factor Ell [Anabrus simplex]|uniref:RNA polymerase II elongation factor Ell n=1 Tax=Anabrus simplex TaxID=316456 RepID=UPI0035A30091
MAALVQGVQYGLSSQENFIENKSLIFVKLTDSAYRAIEDYLRNKNRTSQHPTIQFLGNEGRLSFPSCESNHGAAGFNFKLSSNADIEGPQGSFECIQQTSSRNLESLGTLQCKMCIQAKDDVYAATRHRMAVAEEAHKKNCTREIKPGGPHIGKKVKLPSGRGYIPPKNDPDTASPSLKYPSNLKPLNGYHPAHHGVLNGGNAPPSIHTKPQGNNYAQKPGNPDIMKRPIRERLIHLLAVRTYKKPELFDRMYKDGLRERDKKNMMEVLKQVASMRDNSYYLLRHVWNDVQENWPYYTEQEKQMLKRRKPQNLTPPGGSDGGSSGSGQSPTSTHPGSPPSTISSNVKRPGYIDGADGLPTKRARISHYRKPSETSGYRPPDSSQQRTADSSRSDLPYRRMDRDTSNMNLRSREYGSSDHGNSTVLRNSGFSNNSFNSSGVLSVPDRRFVTSDNEASEKCTSGESVGCDSSVISKERVARCEPSASSPSGCVSSLSNSSSKLASEDSSRGRPDSGVRSPTTSSRSHGGHHDNRNSRWSSPPSKVTSTTSNSSSNVSGISSPDSQLENVDQPKTEESAKTADSEYPEYLTSYTTIRNSEQRSRYKADFNADYSEYRDLHAIVETVSRHFAQLEERLRQEKVNSPGWKQIKQQIMREYQENKRNAKHQEAKRRFQYLHEKLSHIKRLVLEYDSAVSGNHY